MSGEDVLKARPLGLVGEAIGNLLESPEHTIGVEVESKEKIACQHGVDVVEDETITIAVVEAYLTHFVLAVTKGQGKGSLGKDDLDWFG